MPNLNRLKKRGPKSTNLFNDDHLGMSEKRRATFRETLSAHKKNETAKHSKMARQPLASILKGQDPKHFSIARRIKLIAQSGLSDADAFIHDTALMIIEAALLSGDATRLHSLFLAMPNGLRRLKLMNWVNRFTPFTLSKMKAAMKREQRPLRQFDRTSADNSPFFRLT